MEEMIEKAEYIGLYPSRWARHLYRINTQTGCVYIRLGEKDVWPESGALFCWEYNEGDSSAFPLWTALPVEACRRICLLPHLHVTVHSMDNNRDLKKPPELKGVKRTLSHVASRGHGGYRTKSITQYYISGLDVWIREPCAHSGYFKQDDSWYYYQLAAWIHLKNAVPVMKDKSFFAARALWHKSMAQIHEEQDYIFDTFWDDMFTRLHQFLHASTESSLFAESEQGRSAA